MKKRLFRMLLILCLLVAALTVMVSAAEPATPSFTHTDTSHAKYSISFAFKAYYRCPGNLVTAVSPTDPYRVTNINSWTSDEIEFQIEVTSVRCAGDSSVSHIAHQADVVNPSKRVTFSGKDLCHKPLNLTTTIKDVIFDGQNDELKFTVTTTLPRYQLVPHAESNPTCIEYGYSKDCYECPGCKKLFKDQNAEQELPASVRLAMTPHNYVNGECTVCHATGEAYTLSPNDVKTYYDTVEAALAAAYDNPDNLSVWITHYEHEDAITLTNSCNVHVCNGVTIPKICTSASGSQAAINITNHGTIGTITPASSGTQTLDITNWGSIPLIDIPDNELLSVMITNNGTIAQLSPKKPIKLQSGIGTYEWIHTVYPKFTLGELLGDGCKFYLYKDNKQWKGREYHTYSSTYLIVTKPPFFAKIVDNHNAELSKDESGGYSLNLNYTAAQNQTLTASLSYPNANTSLSSEGAEFTRRWYYTGADTAKWKTKELPLSELPVGIHQLTLRVTDNKYNYTHSINVTVTITSDDGEKVPVSLQTPEGSFTKMYDGTDKVPENLPINFIADGKELVLQQVTSDDEAAEAKVGYRIVTAAYNSQNCNEAATITVKVELTTAAKDIYKLTTGTFTVKGTITKFEPKENYPFFDLSLRNRNAKVGNRIMDSLTETNVTFTRSYYYEDTSLYPLDANPTITYYRMRTDNIYDPTTDEKITENSIFAYEGDYIIYAVVGETENYTELFTEYTTLTAKSASGSHTHCRYGHKDCTADDLLTYNAFSKASLSPDGSHDQLSYYLNAEKSNVNLDLILRKLSDSSSEAPLLGLCLYGKTLHADGEFTEQFRVLNKWHLSFTDCTGVGVLKGTSVDDEHGGCLYVADAAVDISNIKITGGSSSQLGGAIVVDKDGTLNLYSGEISGNTVTSGNGGAIYIKSGGTVNIYGCTIRNNHAYSGKGGAIYVAEGGTLNLYGGEITGNTASTLGGGIYVEAGGTLNIKGNPVVTGNTAGGQPSNVYLAQNQRLYASDMTAGAKIGISVEATSYPAGFAVSEQNYSAYFTPDAPDTFVVFSGSALTLCAKPSATLEGSTLTVKTGSNYMDNTVLLFVAEYSADGRLLTAQSQAVKLGTPDYTFKVVSSSKIKCFLLNAQTYTPLMEAFVFN